ncbi:Pyruvate/Phosphoenolpyruvate kinase-like domain-containing protein [Xylariales sp. PMI_506]|nr:Pyruvate/Phosphoenolpyruvate kinase-like domain-containing protein [Xylariales sp. PMI_506]
MAANKGPTSTRAGSRIIDYRLIDSQIFHGNFLSRDAASHRYRANLIREYPCTLIEMYPVTTSIARAAPRITRYARYITTSPSHLKLQTKDYSTMLQSCKLRSAFTKGGGASLGLWQCLPGSNVSRILATTSGIDWVMVDCEHGNIGDAAMHEAVPAIAACGVSPIVRIPGKEGWMIKRALDSGAHGILVPLLRSAEEAKEIVAAAKFPPTGQRGFGSPFAMGRFKPVPTMTEYLQQANESLLTMVQIETREALGAVKEIAAVPGIDVLFVGPFDLGNNIGHPILNGHVKPELEEAIDNILIATHKAGKKAGYFATGPEDAKKLADKGYDMISVALDAVALTKMMATSVSTAQGN